MERQLAMPLTADRADQEIQQLPDAELIMVDQFLGTKEADSCYHRLCHDTPWEQAHLNFGGKRVPIPRLQAWYGDSDSYYSYSGLKLTPLPWTPLLEALRQKVSSHCKTSFNSALINYYRDGKDSVAWHSDDEKELGREPLIASLSLGTTRQFELKHRQKKLPKSVLALTHGSLLVMSKDTQHCWHHQVPKQPGITEGRINLTFRRIIDQ